MITSVTDFEEATSFERWALEGLVPLPSARPHGGVKDMQRNEVRISPGTAVVRVYAGGVREVNVDLRPLAFGAAWKVLDLLLELAIAQSGATPTGRITITEKVRKARLAAGVCPPLSTQTSLWRTLTMLYAATEEIRHSLVHRLAEVDRTTGELVGRDSKGNPLAPISSAQQEAFCRAVQRSAQAVISGSLSPRERSDLAWNLDQLAPLHAEPVLGGSAMQAAPLGLAPTRRRGELVVIDAPALLQELRANFPDRAAYDASFELSDGRHLLAELEQAPSTEVVVDLLALPAWIQFWGGPGSA